MPELVLRIVLVGPLRRNGSWPPSASIWLITSLPCSTRRPAMTTAAPAGINSRIEAYLVSEVPPVFGAT